MIVRAGRQSFCSLQAPLQPIGLVDQDGKALRADPIRSSTKVDFDERHDGLIAFTIEALFL